MAGEDLVPGTARNVSACAGEVVAVTPTGAKRGELEAEHIAVVGRDGRQLEGSPAPMSELALPLAQRGDGAVAHTHALLATALSLVIDELPEAVLPALEGRAAALMANHGAVTVGPDPDTAVEASLLLEWACGLYLRTAAIGEPRVLDERHSRR